MDIGQRIKARRVELKMSQEELAERLGYKSRSTINKIELGGRNLRQSKIVAIAKALSTTPGYIMGWEDDEPETLTPVLSPELERVSAAFSKLNEEGVEKILDYVDDVVASGRYQKNNSSRLDQEA